MKYFYFCIIMMGLLLGPVIPAQAGQSLVVTPSLQLEVAKTLEGEGAYSSTAHEYVRFYHLFPGHPKKQEAQYRAGDAFFKAGMHADALRILKQAAQPYGDDTPAPQALFKQAQVHVALKSPDQAVRVLNNLVTLSQSEEIQDRAHFLLAWLYIDNAADPRILGLGKADPIDRARTHILALSHTGRARFRADDALVRRLEEIQTLEQKNPTLAGLAAIVPGGGFLYTERYKDALVGFLFNTAMILASYKAFDQDQDFLGGIIAFVETGFYSGNIYGAVSSAHKYNRNARTRAVEKLKADQAKKRSRSLVRIQPKVSPGEAGLFFSLSF